MVTPASLPQPFLPLNSTQATLETVGGKGANLARLARTSFNVPHGFLIPTESYRKFVAEHQLDAVINNALADLDVNDPAALQTASQTIRAQFELASVSKALRDALIIAYGWIGAPPVAVRSSATAEDLPDMSFAGQQDTYLNIIGADALTDAVVACWSSLWTARAIGYRARNEIPQENVSLSVVVQEMVEADVSGVMFTANPLSGKRDEIVIDATFGLGEALVSGQVEPDNYIVESALHPQDAMHSASGKTRSTSHLKADATHFSITSKTLGAKATVIRSQPKGGIKTETSNQAKIQACPDEVILQLAELGQQIQSEYNFPQDIEWAYHEESLYILQSRPITSLYPLPPTLPASPLKLMFGLHIVQGVIEPYSPLGMQTLENVLAGSTLAFGGDLSYKNQTVFHEAGERIWIDITSILKHPLGHKIYPTAIRSIDPAVGQVLEKLRNNPEFAPKHKRPNPRTIINLLKFAIPFWGHVIGYWWHPEKGAARFFSLVDAKVTETQARSETNENLWADFKKHLETWHESRCIFSDLVVPYGISAVVAGMVPLFGILQRFSQAIGEPMLYLEISRGLAHNVTTEMDLFLWKTAQTIRADTESAKRFAETPALQLATDFQQNALPNTAQQAVTDFLSRYGMRGLGEIDMGRKRWREAPFHIIQTLQSYLEITDPELAPDVVFEKGAQAAVLAGKELESKVRSLKGGWLKSRLVRWAVSRYRPLAGLREAPKFFAIQMIGIIREGLLKSGKALVAANVLKEEDDLFFLRIEELEEIAKEEKVSAEVLEKIAARRALRAREMRRKQLPRVLLSDGTAFFGGMRDVDNEAGIFGPRFPRRGRGQSARGAEPARDTIKSWRNSRLPRHRSGLDAAFSRGRRPRYGSWRTDDARLCRSTRIRHSCCRGRA